jgi:O-antigen ligase
MLGIYGYIAHYSIGPDRQWWAQSIKHWGLRYSFWLAIFTAMGVAINYRSLRYGRRLLTGHEKLLVLFLAMIWLSWLIGPPVGGLYEAMDHPTVKATKLLFFTLLVTHVVTDLKKWNTLVWTLVFTAFILGLDAYEMPRSAYEGGRLEGVGGPDFAEANFLGAYLGSMLPIIAMQFLRSGWAGKAFCAVSGVFATNAIILTRSRAAALGVAAGALTAVVLAPRKYRLKMVAGLIVAAAGMFYLSDPQFLERTATISASQGERDASAQGRIETWETSLVMLKDRPWGFGAGNFQMVVGTYNPKFTNRDAHNTYVRCYTELGVQGMLVFGACVVNAFLVLRRVKREAMGLPQPYQDRLIYASLGLAVGLAGYLVCGITGSLLYIESLWWLLALPVCLARSLENAIIDSSQVSRVPERR